LPAKVNGAVQSQPWWWRRPEVGFGLRPDETARLGFGDPLAVDQKCVAGSEIFWRKPQAAEYQDQ
jgi:hypothetical protein